MTGRPHRLQEPDLPSSPAAGTLASVQWLRAVAALAVVIFHLAEKLPGKGAIGDIPIALAGAAGVDIFFCLSGFIMWTTTAGRPMTPGSFLRLRAVRILPLYWLLTTVLLVTSLAWPSVFPRLVLTPDHVATSYLLLPWRSPSDGLIAPLLVQGWTLAYEAFFYLVFALCLTLDHARRLRALSITLLAAVGLGLTLQPSLPAWIVYTNPLLLEFLAGAWIAQRRLDGRLALSRGWASGLAALAIAALLVSVLADPATLDRWRIIVWGLPAAAVLVSAVARERDIARWPRVGVAVGDASYAIYLLQGIVIAITAKLLASHTSSVVGAALFIVVALAACVAAGLACYRWLEYPMTRMLRTRTRVPPKVRSAPRPSLRRWFTRPDRYPS